MRIVIISTPPIASWGGSEELWAAMALRALAEGHQVAISPRKDRYNKSHKLLELENAGAQLFPSVADEDANQLSAYYLKLFIPKPDIVFISNGGNYQGLISKPMIDLLNFYNIPYLISCRLVSESAFVDLEYLKITTNFFLRAKRIIFPSLRNLRAAERHFSQRLHHGLILHSPVNLSELNIVEWPSLEDIHFATVARLEPIQKGQDILFEALHQSEWSDRNWKLRLYGSGLRQEYFQDLAKFYQIDNKIQFLGFESNIRLIWTSNHLLVLPSREEGAPISLIEAMLCGRPSVVTDVGGNSEWVTDGSNGFVAGAATAQSVNEALNRAWQAKENWLEMGINAHKSALEKYDKDVANNLLDIISSSIQ